MSTCTVTERLLLPVEHDTLLPEECGVLSVCATLCAYPFTSMTDDFVCVPPVDIEAWVVATVQQRKLLLTELTDETPKQHDVSVNRMQSDLHKLNQILYNPMLARAEDSQNFKDQIFNIAQTHNRITIDKAKQTQDILISEFNYSSPHLLHRAKATVKLLSKKLGYTVLAMIEAQLDKQEQSQDKLQRGMDKIVRAISKTVVYLVQFALTQVEHKTTELYRATPAAIQFLEKMIMDLLGCIDITVTPARVCEIKILKY